MGRPARKVRPSNLGVAALLEHFATTDDTRASLSRGTDIHPSRLRRIIVDGAVPSLREACVLQDRVGVHVRLWLDAVSRRRKANVRNRRSTTPRKRTQPPARSSDPTPRTAP